MAENATNLASFFFFLPLFFPLIQVINCVEWSGESFQRPYLKE